MPTKLRELLEVEIEAGNTIVEVGHNFPAPPAGAYFKLSKPVSTRPRESGDGIEFYDRANPYYSGEYSDAKRFYFILEPPHQNSTEEEIRGKNSSERSFREETKRSAVESPMLRFEESMNINYEKWHDGIGYDLKALQDSSPKERQQIEEVLLKRNPLDWRDVEALAELGTPLALERLRAAKVDSNPEVRMAVNRFAPDLINNDERASSIVSSLRNATFFGGLSQTLDQVEEFHPQKVIDELLRGCIHREGEVAVHFAAMILFIYGKTKEPF